MLLYPLLQCFPVPAFISQWEFISSDTSVPVTDCWPLPAPYFTSCECSLTLRSILYSFATVPQVTYSTFLPEKFKIH